LSGFLYGAIPGLGPFFAYGLISAGLGMLITGFWAFRAGNVFGGVGMSTIGSLFASAAFYGWIFLPTSKSANAEEISWILFAVAAVVLLIALASFKAKIPRPGSVTLLLLFLTLAVDWAGLAFHVPSASRIAGVIGVVTAVMAWIGGFSRLMMDL